MIAEELREALRVYIVEKYLEIEDNCTEYELDLSLTKDLNKNFSKKETFSLEELVNEVGESFHEMLFLKIDMSGMTDVEVYKRANMDRKLFSKIRSNPAYHPRK